jgi:hypothetical protein
MKNYVTVRISIGAKRDFSRFGMTLQGSKRHTIFVTTEDSDPAIGGHANMNVQLVSYSDPAVPFFSRKET